jgi:dehydrogenase/reductase SDR family protein 7B
MPYRTSYAASKFAVQGYCEALRRYVHLQFWSNNSFHRAIISTSRSFPMVPNNSEVASSGVTVHCVSPGYLRTNLSLSALKGDGEAYGKMDATIMNGADPVKVAKSILHQVDQGVFSLFNH